uniref:Uncharacterized protein n=1 Tax=Oncorhynchus kisutch TaxID=8019 RepID=A0A8C7J9Z1_ONCKI
IFPGRWSLDQDNSSTVFTASHWHGWHISDQTLNMRSLVPCCVQNGHSHGVVGGGILLGPLPHLSPLALQPAHTLLSPLQERTEANVRCNISYF